MAKPLLFQVKYPRLFMGRLVEPGDTIALTIGRYVAVLQDRAPDFGLALSEAMEGDLAGDFECITPDPPPLAALAQAAGLPAPIGSLRSAGVSPRRRRYLELVGD